MKRLAMALALWPLPAMADFIDNNLLAIFYHELGHAVIDQLQVPIFGQEEDAADSLSILLIDAYYENDDAEQIAYDSAALFLAGADEAPDFWGTHGPNEQRYYNTVCLFYGADPDARQEFSEVVELPAERAESCAEEFELASASWHAVLDEMSENKDYTGELVLQSEVDMAIIADEIVALNNELKWPQDVPVYILECGEANAFYDPSDGSIVMCSELTGWLTDVIEEINQEW